MAGLFDLAGLALDYIMGQKNADAQKKLIDEQKKAQEKLENEKAIAAQNEKDQKEYQEKLAGEKTDLENAQSQAETIDANDVTSVMLPESKDDDDDDLLMGLRNFRM